MKCALSPRGYTCAVPPRHVAAVTARDVFSSTGRKRVMSPPGLVVLVESSIQTSSLLKSSTHHRELRFHVSVTAKKTVSHRQLQLPVC